MRFIVQPVGTDDSQEFERREDARGVAERSAGKVGYAYEVVELDAAGDVVRVEEYDPDDGWVAEIRSGTLVRGPA